MKEHEFKIQHDKVTDVWRVFVKVKFLMFSWWTPVCKEWNGCFLVLKFHSEADCMRGIEKWKLENSPDYCRYDTTHIKK